MASSVRLTARVININRAYLLPVIFLFCVIGVFALSNRMFDVWVVIGFGVTGFLMERTGMPLGPFVIGFVLSRILEGELRSGLMWSGGSYLPLITRPIALAFTIVSIIVLIYPLFDKFWKFRRTRKLKIGPKAGEPESETEPANQTSEKT
jgi:putative tricarboxylic transport membrane protein